LSPDRTRAPTQEEDKTYLKEVHAEAIQYNGLTVKHFETFCKHFEVGLGAKADGAVWDSFRATASSQVKHHEALCKHLVVGAGQA
jgi:hypothetical protein